MKLAGAGLLLLVALGCVEATPGADPDAMSAPAHREEAARHDREGRKHERQADTQARAPSSEWLRYPQEWEVYDPTEATRRLAREHQRHAEEHREAARALEEFEEAECAAFRAETRAACPLLARVVAVEDTAAGVRVRLAESAPIHAIIAHVRCHIAFGRARAGMGMSECPLYVPGVRAELAGPPPSIDLVTASPEDRDVLRSRAARLLVHDR